MQDSGPVKPKRRWYQFSLRTLMVFVLLCAILCSWVAVRTNRVRRQRQAVAEIRKVHPAAIFAYSYESARYGQKPWLAKLFGDDFYPVVEVNLVGEENLRSHIREATLIQLGKLTSLQELSFMDCQVTGEGFEHLKGLTSLQTLYLNRAQVGHAGLEHLKGLTSLQTLYLHHAQVGDAGLEHLKGLTSLRRLRLTDAQVTDAGLEHLKQLTNLEDLDFGHTPVTDEGVEKLQQALPNCQIRH